MRSALFGSSRGDPFDDVTQIPQTVVGIRALRIHHGFHIVALQAEYVLADGSIFVADAHGEERDELQETHIIFPAGEVITEIRGLIGPFLVAQLTFVTTDAANTTRVYGPYGTTEVEPFRVQERVAGFYGKSGGLIDSIGVYYDGWCLLYIVEPPNCPEAMNIQTLL